MGSQGNYKRSWRNLLLNRGYQLRFTLTTVGVSLLLLTVLGGWVLRVADRATQIAINNVRSVECGTFSVEAPNDETAEPDTNSRRRAVVVTTEMKSVENGVITDKDTNQTSASPVSPLDAAKKIEECEAKLRAEIQSLEDRQRLILGLLLSLIHI